MFLKPTIASCAANMWSHSPLYAKFSGQNAVISIGILIFHERVMGSERFPSMDFTSNSSLSNC